MKEKRLTRRESQELTRAKLLEAAATLFARDGFDATSVERIADEAGFTRGAFYSNFSGKDELFLALLERRSQATQGELDAILRDDASAVERFQKAREWYASHWKLQQWTILRTEFHLRSLRNKTAAKRVAKLIDQELNEVAGTLTRYNAEAGAPPLADPRVEALALFAMSYGLGLLTSFCPSKEMEALAASARNLVYDRLVAPPAKNRKSQKA